MSPAQDVAWHLHRAADSVRRATANVPPGQPPAPPRRLRRVLGGVALGAALAASVAVIWKGSERSRQEEITTGETVEIAALVLDPPPEGTGPTEAGDLPARSGATGGQPLGITLYRGNLAFDGNAVVDLGVVVAADEALVSDGDPVTVRGRDAVTTDAGPFGGTTVTWREPGDVEITLASGALDVSLLLAIAETLRVVETESATSVFLGDLPDAVASLSPVAIVDDLDLTGTLGLTRDGRGHVVQYGDGDTPLTVGTMEGGDQLAAAVAWAIRAGDSRPAGERAVFVGTAPTGDRPTVAIWQEDDEVVGYLVGDLPADELLDLVADNLHEASPTEWQAVLDDTRS